MSDKYQALIDSLRDHQNGGRRNECDEAARAIETLRAANARLQAWHDAVMGQETIGFEIVFKTGKWLKYDPSGFAPETKTELIIRPQPLAKE